MVRTPCCDKTGLKKGPWTPEEDSLLTSYIQQHGHGNWRALPKQAGLLRCGKSCRLRWTNYLRPDIKRGNFTREEEDAIITLHHQLGNKWSAIAAKFPGRTDNEIKNVWHTHLKKRRLQLMTTPQEEEEEEKGGANNQQQQLPKQSTSASRRRSRSKKEAAATTSSLPEEQTTTPTDIQSCGSAAAAEYYSPVATTAEEEEFPELDDSFWSEELTSIGSSSSRSTDVIDYINIFEEEAILSSAGATTFPDDDCGGGSGGVMGFWLRALQQQELEEQPHDMTWPTLPTYLPL